jgi:hypothetical protein
MQSTARLWRVSTAAGVTPLWAVGSLLLGLAVGEIAARSPYVRSQLAAPSVGSPSRLLELQRAALDTQAMAEGGVDCIFLGNSLVLFGIDPAAFASAYGARMDTAVRAFNFAVPGTAVSQMAPIARILHEDYRPRWLIYGMTKRDFNAATNGPAIEAIPWVRYRLGALSIDGWLAEHSLLYGYVLQMVAAAASTGPGDDAFARTLRRGFHPAVAATIFDDAQITRAMELVNRQVALRDDSSQLLALDDLLQLGPSGTTIALVEMPVHLATADWPAAAVNAYAEAMEPVKRRARAAGVPFWTAPPDLIPPDGWVDLWHLNAIGAEAFSRWLGEHAATAVRSGELPPLGPVAPAPNA